MDVRVTLAQLNEPLVHKFVVLPLFCLSCTRFLLLWFEFLDKCVTQSGMRAAVWKPLFHGLKNCMIECAHISIQTLKV